MRLLLPGSLIAGFHGEAPDAAVPELNRVGEQWLPGSQPIPMHCHEDWELYLQLDGLTCWNGPDRGYLVSAGTLFVAPPGVEHALCTSHRQRHHFLFAGIDINAVLRRYPELAPVWNRRSIILRGNAGTLIAPFRLLVREVALNQAYRSAGLRSALDAVVVEASRLIATNANPCLFVPTHQAVARAKALMESAPQLGWNLGELAQAAGISVSRLSQLFKHEVGTSPRQFLLQARIERAKQMLETSDSPITSIGHELGFASSQHFAVVFRRQVGETAGAYRERTRSRMPAGSEGE